ncbi:DUF1127 domain-containing protein [Pseudoroseicyclus sp. CXY001]|uniref:DUF1127 domain-containing protein n=1 Tax=Pseudoroseicyclus sp. CXY001 TaxID=3242492 RepID=UPI00358DA4E7
MDRLIAPASTSSATRVAGPVGLAAVVRAIATWQHRYTSRRRLARLSPAMLRDIGLDSRAAELESSLPFWKP